MSRPVEFAKPLVENVFTADPSAHIFEGRIYVYCSHDIDSGLPVTDDGSHFAMTDYRILSWAGPGGEVVDHADVLHVRDVPWATRQMWAPDAMFRDGTYYLFFPAKDREDVFRIGVATSARPEGPFRARPEPLRGSFSIDPCAFVDSDGQAYLYFGGLWGGQLECWQSGQFDVNAKPPSGDAPALGPRVARLDPGAESIEGAVEEIQILDEHGAPLKASDTARRYFEGPWVHRYGETYYLSYSTGDTHYLVYATGTSPRGPFTYRGRLLEPVVGWTTHHSIVEYQGSWYLFYHDCVLSGGVTHLRSVKVVPLQYGPDGSIATIDPATLR